MLVSLSSPPLLWIIGSFFFQDIALSHAQQQDDVVATCQATCDEDLDSCTTGCENAALAVGSTSGLYSCRSDCYAEQQSCREFCAKPEVESGPILCQEFEFLQACQGTVLDTVPEGNPFASDLERAKLWEAFEYTKRCEREDYEPGSIYYTGSVFMKTATFCPDYPYPSLNEEQGGQIRSHHLIVEKDSCDENDICTWRLVHYWSTAGGCGSDAEKEAQYHCAEEAYFRANRESPHLDTAATIFCQDGGPEWPFVETPLEISCVKENEVDGGGSGGGHGGSSTSSNSAMRVPFRALPSSLLFLLALLFAAV